jgi:ribonuclease HII
MENKMEDYKELVNKFDVYLKNLDYEKFDINQANDFINLLKNDTRKGTIKKVERLIKFINKFNNEVCRVRKLYDFDLYSASGAFLGGVDEVGRGPLAGPIVAATVVLDLNVLDKDLILEINDSKKLSQTKRELLSNIIKEKAISYCISEVSNTQIDEKGIAYCNNKIFVDSFKGLNIQPKIILSDGYKIKGLDILNTAVIKGDTKSASIACASIIAKVYRDNLMMKYNEIYPQYHFDKNVGYGTTEHVEAIKKYGITPIHRKSFLKNIISQ